jgi:hypothetical protein
MLLQTMLPMLKAMCKRVNSQDFSGISLGCIALFMHKSIVCFACLVRYWCLCYVYYHTVPSCFLSQQRDTSLSLLCCLYLLSLLCFRCSSHSQPDRSADPAPHRSRPEEVMPCPPAHPGRLSPVQPHSSDTAQDRGVRSISKEEPA